MLRPGDTVEVLDYPHSLKACWSGAARASCTCDACKVRFIGTMGRVVSVLDVLEVTYPGEGKATRYPIDPPVVEIEVTENNRKSHPSFTIDQLRLISGE